LHHDAHVAEQAALAALDELTLVESLMSLYRADSQLVQLNRTGRLSRPHPHLVTVLRAADDAWRRTEGAFDATVQPLWKLYAEARRARRTPTLEELNAARRRVDWSAVRIEDDYLELARPEVELTLNGIAQGFATDRVIAALRERGIERAIVDVGEIGALGRQEQDQPWTVGIQHPRRPEDYLALARLDGRCLATSGDYATRLSDDGAVHHVFDPRTGRSPQEVASVTVLAPTALEADALSTACMVLGLEQADALLSRTPGVDALFHTTAGRTVATRRFPVAARQEES
jgi:thiamine biosynthesis lipoprotein